MNTMTRQSDGYVLLNQETGIAVEGLCSSSFAFASGRILLFSTISASITAFGLHVIIIDTESLINLGAKSIVIINPDNMLAYSGTAWFNSTYNERSSELSISKSIPVILPASSG